MKAIIEIKENQRELIAHHLANPETKLLNHNQEETDDIKAADYLQVEITMEQLTFKPRKKREGNE